MLSQVIPETPMDYNTLHSFHVSFLVALLVVDSEISVFSLHPSMILLADLAGFKLPNMNQVGPMIPGGDGKHQDCMSWNFVNGRACNTSKTNKRYLGDT